MSSLCIVPVFLFQLFLEVLIAYYVLLGSFFLLLKEKEDNADEIIWGNIVDGRGY